MPETENTNTPAASTATPSATPLPDSMSQPGAAAPVMESVAAPNITQGNLPAYGEPGAPAQPSTVVPVGQPVAQPPAPSKHQVLARMVQSLSDGLAGLSEGMASKGKVSGSEVVQGLEGQRAEQAQRATAAAQAQKNADLQNQLTTGQINEMNVKNHILGQTWNDTVNQSHFAAQEAGLNLQQKAQEIFDTTGRVPTGWSADSNTGQLTQGAPANNSAAVGTNPPTTAVTPGAGQPATPSMYDRRAGIILDAVGKELADSTGKEDPAVTNARQLFAPGSTATIEQKQQALLSLQQKAGMNQQVIKNLTEKADLAVKQQAGSQGAIKTDQEKLAQATYNRTVPKNAQGLPTEDFATWQARVTKEAEVKAQQGDPSALGEMAADGLITIPQIAIARQLDKKGFQTLLAAADARAKANGAPEIQVNGKGTGHYFNANAATQQYDYVKEFNNPNSKNQQSINSGSTFMEHMNDLLAVNQKYARTKTKVLNTPLNKIADLFGNETYTELLAAIAPVKTEYDNALKAGFAPTAEDSATVEQLLKPNSTPAQIETAGKTMAHTILRRLNSTNQGYKTHTGTDYPNMLTPDAAAALQNMGIDTGGLQSGGSFGGVPQAGVTAKAPVPPAGATGKGKASDGNWYYHDAKGNNLGKVQ